MVYAFCLNGPRACRQEKEETVSLFLTMRAGQLKTQRARYFSGGPLRRKHQPNSICADNLERQLLT
jgi:hypothetical protein